jgi:ubiquinone/menaquinone biosynthesis C-methylase UbiE
MSKHNDESTGTKNLMDKIAFLDGEQRRKTLPPEEILNMLSIKKSDRILDAGAGSGYLTIPAAKLVNDTVYALDLDTRMLDVIDAKAKAENIKHIKLVQGSIDHIPMTDSAVNHVLAALVLHEARPLPKVLREISRVLNTGGYFLCLEYEKEDSTVQGPPMHIRIPSSELEQELANAGFRMIQKVIPSESLYIITAEKTGDLFTTHNP